jgi:hypothetical protein
MLFFNLFLTSLISWFISYAWDFSSISLPTLSRSMISCIIITYLYKAPLIKITFVYPLSHVNLFLFFFLVLLISLILFFFKGLFHTTGKNPRSKPGHVNLVQGKIFFFLRNSSSKWVSIFDPSRRLLPRGFGVYEPTTTVQPLTYVHAPRIRNR